VQNALDFNKAFERKERADMFCPECGKNIPDNSKVCGYCGFRLPLGEVQPTPPVVEEPTPPTIEEPGRRGLPSWAYAVIGIFAVGIVIAILVISGLFGRTNPSASAPAQQEGLRIGGIGGGWEGTITAPETGWSDHTTLEIDDDCDVNSVCGSYQLRDAGCTGDLILRSIESDGFVFEERLDPGSPCEEDTWEFLKLLSEDSLEFNVLPNADFTLIVTMGVLERIR
jgi:hypothetical protein